jgi:hypothetical protein
VRDRDVILVRKGVQFTPLTGNYDPDTATGGLCGVPVPNPGYDPNYSDDPVLGLQFLQSTPSEDEDGLLEGCNYTIAAFVDSPVVGRRITIKRGFVGVDATVHGKTYRFVNTHIEGVQPNPVIQYLQSVELVGTLQVTTPPDRTLILLGDFNSSSDDLIGAITPPYQIIVGAGFADVWERNLLKFFDWNGFTCCQDKDLLNTTSLLDERIDIIFVRDTSFLPLAFVTGRVPIFPLSQPPNWASDHGGVFGKLIFREARWTDRPTERRSDISPGAKRRAGNAWRLHRQ